LSYGLQAGAPHIYAAGNFGINTQLFHARDEKEPGLIVYPRRAIPGINYLGFLRAISELPPDVPFRAVGVGLAEVTEELLTEFDEADLSRVELTERMTQHEFAWLLRRASIVVSPARFDGTPNTVIEAYACGAHLVVGRLEQFESLAKEGLDLELIDPEDWRAMKMAILKCLDAPELNSRSLPREFDRKSNEIRFRAFYAGVFFREHDAG